MDAARNNNWEQSHGRDSQLGHSHYRTPRYDSVVVVAR